MMILLMLLVVMLMMMIENIHSDWQVICCVVWYLDARCAVYADGPIPVQSIETWVMWMQSLLSTMKIVIGMMMMILYQCLPEISWFWPRQQSYYSLDDRHSSSWMMMMMMTSCSYCSDAWLPGCLLYLPRSLCYIMTNTYHNRINQCMRYIKNISSESVRNTNS